MSQLFGTDQDGKPIPRDDNEPEPWHINQANIKKNVGDIET